MATEASHEAYRRTIAEWLAKGRPAPGPTVRPLLTLRAVDLTIGEMILAFWGTPSSITGGPMAVRPGNWITTCMRSGR